MTTLTAALRLPVLATAAAVLVVSAGCNVDKTKPVALGSGDSISLLNTRLSASTADVQKLSTEKDTLISTLQNAMAVAHEIETLQQEIDTKPRRQAKNAEGIVSWDAKVRTQIEDVRARIKEQKLALDRANARLRSMTSKNGALSAQLAQALQTIEQLQADNQQQAAHIQEMANRIEGLERDKVALTVETRARGDTIVTLRDDNNRVYWIADTKDRLRTLGVIKQQGGKSLLVTRVGETFTPGNDLNPTLFKVLDKSRDARIVLPDNADYEIVSPQNVAYVTPASAKKPRIMRGQIVINDKRFWDNSPYLILMRH